MKTDIKNHITDALFKLLENKELSNIKIVELVNLTGISRTSFYNNFNNLDDVITYKLNIIIEDIKKVIILNNLRNKNLKNLLLEILKYIDKNKSNFIIIKNKLFFKFKKTLDKELNSNNYDYYIKSGIIINLCLLYIDNNFYIDLDKIKID